MIHPNGALADMAAFLKVAMFSLSFCLSSNIAIALQDAQIESVLDFQRLLSEARKGDSRSQYELAVAYEDGNEIGQNLTQAFVFMRKAAVNDYPKAQSSLGEYYEKGIGVEKDLTQAIVWYRKAAEQDDSNGLFKLAHKYSHGEGVEKDQSKAIELYEKVAEKGFEVAQFNLALIYEYDESNLEKALHWYRKSAENGYVNSQRALGRLFEDGKGVESDLSKAVYWFRQAVEQLDEKAFKSLVELHKTCGAKERAQIIETLSQAAELSNNFKSYLASAYLNGYSLPTDFAISKRYFEDLLKIDRYKIEARVALIEIDGKKYGQRRMRKSANSLLAESESIELAEILEKVSRLLDDVEQEYLLRKAFEIRKRLQGADSSAALATSSFLSECLGRIGDYEQQLILHQRNLESIKRVEGEGSILS